MQKILVISAHPGDEVLGCGGTLALHVEKGDQVRITTLGDGWTSRLKSLEKGREAIDLSVLEEQNRATLRVLGVSHVEFFRFPDNRFDTVPLLDIVKCVEKVKQDYRPDVVYTNSSTGLSVDQQLTCRAVLTAFRPMPHDNHATLYAYEVLASTDWNVQGSSQQSFAPNTFVNIEKTLSRKLDAFKVMDSEVRKWPHARSFESVKNLAKARGATVGFPAAEAFMLLRQTNGP
ncbi:MAG: PIG-L family deacetylase [SAR202 cluster bacterium]|nr:PIG-L family deacetylase [SAR202 cluster bacterium]